MTSSGSPKRLGRLAVASTNMTYVDHSRRADHLEHREEGSLEVGNWVQILVFLGNEDELVASTMGG
jgi:hypothetical protein